MITREQVLLAVIGPIVGALLVIAYQRIDRAIDHSGPELVADLVAVPFRSIGSPFAESSGVDDATGYDWHEIRGMVVATVENRGNQPAKDVFLTIPGAIALRRGTELVDAIAATTSRLELGTVPQGHTEVVTVWTSDAYLGGRWSEVEGLLLGYDSGIGIIDPIVLPGDLALLVDRYSSWVTLVLFLCAWIVLWSGGRYLLGRAVAFVGYSPKTKRNSDDGDGERQ